LFGKLAVLGIELPQAFHDPLFIAALIAQLAVLEICFAQSLAQTVFEIAFAPYVPVLVIVDPVTVAKTILKFAGILELFILVKDFFLYHLFLAALIVVIPDNLRIPGREFLNDALLRLRSAADQ
jgi:hypothetical protein